MNNIYQKFARKSTNQFKVCSFKIFKKRYKFIVKLPLKCNNLNNNLLPGVIFNKKVNDICMCVDTSNNFSSNHLP